MTNRERFNLILNSCACREQIYSALSALAKPSVQQADDMGQKRQIIVGVVLAFLDQPQSLQQSVCAL